MKIELKYDEVKDRWYGERLRFKQCADENSWMIINSDEHLLGYIDNIRCGRFRQWCILLNTDCYLSPGYNDEAREMQRILGGLSRKKNGAK